MVIDVAPKLPQHPGFKGRPDRMNASKARTEEYPRSWVAWAHPRSDLDAAVTTPGSNDPIGTFRFDLGWLHDVHRL
ncbi:hypothetical protein SCLCIDRAFT_20265 [Scleroderma citrinum Foug A]|uniref:Uncharacterized protein n=1 Tax=Scleroderma citrinum Foug A TaxID=1036808 RepID=A0A0C3EKA4_9AGAM|nr:hypothetical protein SCLCIDRAFT_20265 [Scleroderma citrinum Foug A]